MSSFAWGYSFGKHRETISNTNDKPIKDDQALRTKLKRTMCNSLLLEVVVADNVAIVGARKFTGHVIQHFFADAVGIARKIDGPAPQGRR